MNRDVGTAGPTPGPPSGPGSPGLVGREREVARLERALQRARDGSGSAWVVQGPAGMGKTRLLRWFEQRGAELGFTAVWAYALQDIPSPFFLVDQAFARLPRPSSTPVAARPPSGEQPAVQIVLADRPDAAYSWLEALESSSRLLLISREMPSRLVAKHPRLSRAARTVWLTRAEGPEHLAPGDLDRLGELVAQHLQESRGGTVAIGGVDYLASQNGFPAVLRLVQFLRDVVESTQGHLILGVSPSTLEPRELALLEAEGEVERPEAENASKKGEEVARPEEPASARLLRYGSTLEQLAQERPLLILLDDLQWADPQSVAAYRYLVKGLPGARAVIAATLREEGPQGVPPELRQGLEALESGGNLERLSLDPLGPAEAELVAATALPGPVRSADAKEWSLLVGRAGGNPYFILETARYLLREGYVREGPEGCSLDPRARELLLLESSSSATTGVPPALSRLLRARLAPLDENTRTLLETASVAGSHFPESALVGALGRPSSEVRRALDALDRTYQLIEPEVDDVGAWEFKHPYVWEVVRELASPATTRESALLLARWWARSRPHQVDQVARLYHESGDREEGLPWVQRASERAERLQAGEALARYARWALDLLGDAPGQEAPRREARRRMAAAYFVQGEGSRGIAELGSLLDGTLPSETRFAIELDLCDALKEVDRGAARSRLAQLEARWPASTSTFPAALELRRAHCTADLYMVEGKNRESLEVAEGALRRFPHAASPLYVAHLYDSVGWASMGLEDYGRAREAFLAGRVVAEESDLQSVLAYHIDGLGSVALKQDRIREALELYREATEVSRRAGDLLNTAIHAGHVAFLLLVAEGLEAARPILEDTLRLVDRLDIAILEDRLRASFGDLALAAGDLVLARRCLLSRGEPPAVSPQVRRLQRLFATCELLAREGRAAEAESLAGKLRSTSDEDDPELFRALRATTQAWTLWAGDRRAEALEGLRAAVERVRLLRGTAERDLRWRGLLDLARALGPDGREEEAKVQGFFEEGRRKMGLVHLGEDPSPPRKT